MSGTPAAIPPSVIKRLTKYLTHVQVLCAGGVLWVSSHELAENLGLTSSTVRQDLSHLDFSGISRRGYQTRGLREVLERSLGADTTWKMVVVGAGNLGKALALHGEFSRRGFHIAGVFDNNERKFGRKFGRHAVQPLRALPTAIRDSDVDIGVIAVPAAAAQSVADLMIAARIRGILNLTQTHIIAPKHIPVVDARILASLQELAHLLRHAAPA